MKPKEFVEALADVKLPSVFNPYCDTCKISDRPDAARVRRRNLKLFLDAALAKNVRTMWVARDLGYRGGRRTGIPLTDEPHLARLATLLGNVHLRRATHGPVVAERTAAVVWKVLDRIQQPIVLWNVFPFHPHDLDDELSNRCHTRKERETTLPFLHMLIEMFSAERVVAIGRDAQLALGELHIPILPVRHPSYGGQNDFISSLYKLYGISRDSEDLFARN